MSFGKKIRGRETYAHVLFEHICRHPDVDHVVDHQFTERGQEVTTFVQLLDFHVFVRLVCNENAT